MPVRPRTAAEAVHRSDLDSAVSKLAASDELFAGCTVQIVYGYPDQFAATMRLTLPATDGIIEAPVSAVDTSGRAAALAQCADLARGLWGDPPQKTARTKRV